jgi:hypothetical protein
VEENTMKRFLLVAALCLVIVGAAEGQATRTWVSGVGDDVNPCSRTAPCKTFAGAISKTAAGGEISVLDPGGYGTLTITKSITVQGTGTLASTLNSGGISGFTINGAGIIVVLRDISINGAGTTLGARGIRFIQGSKLIVERVNIQNQSSFGISIEGPGTINVIDTTISNCANVGYSVQPTTPPQTTKSVLKNVQSIQNGTGVYIANGGLATILNSNLSNNTNAGLVADETFGTVEVNVESSIIAHNGTGITAGNGSVTRLSNVMVVNNTTGFNYLGTGQILSFVNNRIAGNGGPNNNPNATQAQQ